MTGKLKLLYCIQYWRYFMLNRNIILDKEKSLIRTAALFKFVSKNKTVIQKLLATAFLANRTIFLKTNHQHYRTTEMFRKEGNENKAETLQFQHVWVLTYSLTK